MKCQHCNGTGIEEIGIIDTEAKYHEFRGEVLTLVTTNQVNATIEQTDNFIDYWTEMNKSRTKMAYELKRTWDTKRRLQTWIRNDKKFNPKDVVKTGEEKKVWEGNYMDSFKRQ